MPFDKIFPKLLAGNRIRRREWDEGVNVLIEGRRLIWYNEYRNTRRVYHLSNDDVCADDWNIWELKPI
jgi:hypothetical protein